jgi:hypothetical protein
LYTALDLSVRASGYASHVTVHNAALWDTDDDVLSFDRAAANWGAAGLGLNSHAETLADPVNGGHYKVKTVRFDTLFNEEHIYFAKVGGTTHFLPPS